MIKSYLNFYDIIITIIIISLSFGLIGGALQVSRLMAIVMAPCMLLKIKKCRCIQSHVIFFCLFVAYSIISLTWSIDKGNGIKEFLYFIIHFILYFEILVFSWYANNPLNSISKGWTISILMTLIIAIWEITTDNHLPISIQETGTVMNLGGGMFLDRTFASVTFGNYNSYVTFLCLALPFVVYRIVSYNKSIWCKLSLIGIFFLSVVIILLNASRGGLLAILIMLSILFLVSPKSKTVYFTTILIIVIAIILLFNWGNEMFMAIILKSQDGALFNDTSRMVIWENAFDTFLNTCGFGTGIGGLQLSMNIFAKGGINLPHNMFLEILVEFGLIFGLIFFLYFTNLLYKSYKIKDIRLKQLLCIALASFPFISIINSSYLLLPHIFVYFASLFVFIKYEQIKNIH